MPVLGLNPAQWQQVSDACSFFRIDGPAPPYLCRYLAEVLAASSPELAARIGRFGPDEVNLLCDALRQQQTRDIAAPTLPLQH